MPERDSDCCLTPPEKASCTCSYDALLGVIGKKWAVVILNLLHGHERLGYNALRAKMPDVTPKALGDKLKLLEEKGLIARCPADSPHRVFYELTAQGKALLESLAPFFDRSGTFHR